MLGRTVFYRLSAQNATEINRRRTTGPTIREHIDHGRVPPGPQFHIGNAVEEGQVYPLVITRVWSPTTVNGQVLLDGNDVLWVTSVTEGTQPGQFATSND